MGEPLDNLENVERAIDVLTSDWGCSWSPKRITVSTIGINVQKYLDETKTHLAISMHNPYADERQDMMPAEKQNPIDKTMEIIRQYDFTGQRRVSFEYIMFKGLNDNKRHADAIISKLRGLECRVNLIRFHDIGDTKFQSSPMAVIEQFKERLCNAGIIATIRASRGEDIFAACGMLSGLKNKKQ
jgi:23S rRNA (adenine2503-C2)-methyltransferase